MNEQLILYPPRHVIREPKDIATIPADSTYTRHNRSGTLRCNRRPIISADICAILTKGGNIIIDDISHSVESPASNQQG